MRLVNIQHRRYPPTGAPMSMAWPSPEPPAVAPGIEVRFRALCQQIKANPILKPKVSAGGVMVGWGWQTFEKFLDAIEILVDRGDGQSFKLLTIDTTPGCNDTQSFPAAPAKWTYKAVFRVDDQRVGQWSDPVSVNVGS